MSAPSPSSIPFAVRTAKAADAPACGVICFDAFKRINEAHGFPFDLPSPEIAVNMLTTMFTNPGFWCVVAEADGRILGSNCMDERALVTGIGPITIDPSTQNRGVGRALMEAALDRARVRGVAGVRLVQAAFHNRSLALYSSLGFEVREPLSCLQGRSSKREIPGCTVRAATAADEDACNELARRVHGYDRGRDLSESIYQGSAVVVERSGRLTGYSSQLGFFGHATAETNVDLQALIASAESFSGPGILVPSRNSAIMQWCLANGLRIVQPMTLMSTGLYSEPSGAWLPSVLF